MIGDEVPPGHHVAIEQDDIVALRRGDRAIARAAHARAVVWLPQMHQAHRIVGRDAFKQFARGRLRTIVGDDHLVWQLALHRQRRKHALQRLGPVVSDHGNADAHRDDLAQSMSRCSFGAR
jgi:hypothetical protein